MRSCVAHSSTRPVPRQSNARGNHRRTWTCSKATQKCLLWLECLEKDPEQAPERRGVPLGRRSSSSTTRRSSLDADTRSIAHISSCCCTEDDRVQQSGCLLVSSHRSRRGSSEYLRDSRDTRT